MRAVVDPVLKGKGVLVGSCEGGIKGLLMFEDAGSDVDEFAHDGADDGHFGFAVGGEALGKGAQRRVVFKGAERGHVEGFAQVATMTFSAQAFAAPHGGAWNQ